MLKILQLYFCKFFYIGYRTDLLRSNYLSIIDEKDGHFGGLQDLFNQL